MSYPYSLSIIIPAYNESRRLPETIKKISAYFARHKMPHEVIVVDDGSSDETPHILSTLARERDIIVLGDGENHGKGAALREGVLAARGEFVLMTDADLSTPIEEVHKLMPRLTRDGYDVAIGSRALKTSDTQAQPWYRRIVSVMGNWLIRFVLGLPFRDTQCGFKLYRRDVAQKLFRNLSLKRFSFDLEVLLRAKHMGMRVAEVGVRWIHSPFTTVRTSDVLQSFVDVFRLRFGMTEGGDVSLPDMEVVRFITVGFINTAVDASVYLILTRLIPVFADAPVTAKFFGFVAASLCSLLLNRRWTFGITSSLTFAEVARFYVAASVGLIVNVSAMYVLVYMLHVYDLVALALATVLTFGVNYLLAKRWVFKEEIELAVSNI